MQEVGSSGGVTCVSALEPTTLTCDLEGVGGAAGASGFTPAGRKHPIASHSGLATSLVTLHTHIAAGYAVPRVECNSMFDVAVPVQSGRSRDASSPGPRWVTRVGRAAWRVNFRAAVCDFLRVRHHDAKSPRSDHVQNALVVRQFLPQALQMLSVGTCGIGDRDGLSRASDAWEARALRQGV